MEASKSEGSSVATSYITSIPVKQGVTASHIVAASLMLKSFNVVKHVSTPETLRLVDET